MKQAQWFRKISQSKRDPNGKKIQGPEGWPIGVWVMLGLIVAGAVVAYLR